MTSPTAGPAVAPAAAAAAPATQPAPGGPTRLRRISVRGEELLGKVRELVHQGNVRRIVVIGENGASILEFPLTAGVIGALVAPVLVAVGAIAALASNYTLLIEAYTPPEAREVRPPRATRARSRGKRPPAGTG